MKSDSLETFLARLYTDPALRSAFLANPAAVAIEAGLDEDAARALEQIDCDGLELAAESFARKRAARRANRRRLPAWLKGLLGR